MEEWGQSKEEGEITISTNPDVDDVLSPSDLDGVGLNSYTRPGSGKGWKTKGCFPEHILIPISVDP